MTTDEIRAKALAVLREANLVAVRFYAHDGFLSTAIRSDEDAATAALDALSAAGLLPTGIQSSYIGRSRKRQQRYVCDWKPVGE